jgi:hypothetical protein
MYVINKKFKLFCLYYENDNINGLFNSFLATLKNLEKIKMGYF